MNAAARGIAALVSIGFASSSYACGYCIEDKIAAAYDHAVVTRALARKHQVVFFALDGPLAAGNGTRRVIEAIAESALGVDKGSARVHVESAVLSVAFDPARASLPAMERSLSRKLAARGLSTALLRIMDQPAELKPVSQR